MNNKYRVWWIPQVGMREHFIVPVSSPEEGRKVLDILGAYDLFQLQHNVKPDFCNTGNIEMWDEEEQAWVDWYLETEDMYYDDIDDYCNSDDCPQTNELKEFNESMYGQINFETITLMYG